MATKNPRVVGYIDPEDHIRLQEFMKRYSCTESKAIALIMRSYFSSTPVSTPSSRLSETPSITLNDTPDGSELLERLAALEDKVDTLNSTPSNTLDINQLIEEAITRRLDSSLGEYAA